MTPEELRHTLRANIRQIRRDRGMTQADLAAAIGGTQPNISDYEKGASVPTIDSLAKIAEALQVTPDQLFRAEIYSDVA